MPLTTEDQCFLRSIERLRRYVLLTAVLMLVYLLFTPQSEIRTPVTILGLTFCVVLWLTHRLLELVRQLELELTHLTRAIPPWTRQGS